MPGTSSSRYDVVVVGGGHNALTAAAYLARAGLSVVVLERLGWAGGAAVNAVPFGAAQALTAVRDGGTLVTITADRPPSERSVHVQSVVVVPDGPRLAGLGELVSAGALNILIEEVLPLDRAAEALTRTVAGTGGRALVLQP